MHVTINDTGNNSVQLTLGTKEDKVRFSYLKVFKPVPKRDPKTNEKILDDNGDPIMEYSVQVRIPKAATHVVEDANKAIELAGLGFHGEKIWALVKKDPKSNWQLRDGDLAAELKEDPSLTGFWFVNARARRKPDVVGGRKEADPRYPNDPSKRRFIRLVEGDVKSGDWGRIGVSFYGYKEGGGIGVACALNTVQLLEIGDALGGGRNAEQDFDEEDDTDDTDSVL